MKDGANERAWAAASSLPYAAQPTPGVITAGQPRRSQWTALEEGGVRAVVDLREEWEPRGHDEASAVEAAGLRYVAVPFGHGPVPDATFRRVREVMREVSESPVVVHCASGNRVGAALLPWWILDRGLGEEAAVEAALAAGLASRGLALAALDYVRRTRDEQEEAA